MGNILRPSMARNYYAWKTWWLHVMHIFMEKNISFYWSTLCRVLVNFSIIEKHWRQTTLRSLYHKVNVIHITVRYFKVIFIQQSIILGVQNWKRMSLVVSNQSIRSDFSGMLALFDMNLMHTFINRYERQRKKT